MEPRTFPPITDRHPPGFELHRPAGHKLTDGIEAPYAKVPDRCPACGQDRKLDDVRCHRTPADGWVCASGTSSPGPPNDWNQDGPVFGPSNTLSISAGPEFVQLAEDVVVSPGAVLAVIERTYRKDGIVHYTVDVHVAHMRVPILIDDVRLPEIMAKLVAQ